MLPQYFNEFILTFNLPNFQDRVIRGSGTRGTVGTYKAESLPNITGGVRKFVKNIC